MRANRRPVADEFVPFRWRKLRKARKSHLLAIDRRKLNSASLRICLSLELGETLRVRPCCPPRFRLCCPLFSHERFGVGRLLQSLPRSTVPFIRAIDDNDIREINGNRSNCQAAREILKQKLCADIMIIHSLSRADSFVELTINSIYLSLNVPEHKGFMSTRRDRIGGSAR